MPALPHKRHHIISFEEASGSHDDYQNNIGSGFEDVRNHDSKDDSEFPDDN